MTTASTLIQDAMFIARILGQDEQVSSNDSELALRMLNRLMDSWSNVKAMVYSITTESFTMTAGTADYSTSLLAGGRPVVVDKIWVRLSDIDYPVDLISNQEWADITYKPVVSVPSKCYYEPSYPNGTFHFYPKPYAAFTCFVDCRRALSTAVSIGDNLTFPEGYEKAIVDTLAVYISPAFGKTPTEDMRREAKAARQVLKQTNYIPLVMDTGFGKSAGDISNAFLYKGF